MGQIEWEWSNECMYSNQVKGLWEEREDELTHTIHTHRLTYTNDTLQLQGE